MSNGKRYEELNQKNLKQMYIDDNMSAFEIAARIGCSVSAVHAAAKHFGLRKRESGAQRNQSKQARNVPTSLLYELYVDQGMGMKEVHAELVSRGILPDTASKSTRNPFKYLGAKPTKDIVEALYAESHNVNELADKLGVCHKTALNWLREYDIPLVQQKRVTKSQLEKLVAENDSVSAIAEKIGQSEELVMQYAENYGYHIYARERN